MKKVFTPFLIAISLLLSLTTYAQDGTNDPTFNPSDIGFGYGDAANGEIRSIAVQSDGKIIIGGKFTTYNGVSQNHIARLHPNGSLDVTFHVGTGTNANVTDIAIQKSDGRIVIFGLFSKYNDTDRDQIARLNIDGTLDDTFIGDPRGDYFFDKSKIQSDGKIVVSESKLTSSLKTIYRISRLNSDGSPDDTFIGGNITLDESINSMAIQSDDKIIIGGSFISYKSTLTNRIARLKTNGSVDATFNVGTGANAPITTIALQSDNKVIIGGSFTSYNDTPVNHIARLNSDGTLDATFMVGAGTDKLITTATLQSDGKIVISGGFTSYNGTSANRIARLNIDGTLDATFTVGAGINSVFNIAAIQPDDKIIIGGGFTSFNGTSIKGFARLSLDGSLDMTFNLGTGANNAIETTAIQSDGRIIIGGSFKKYNGSERNQIARLNIDGSLDATFTLGKGANSSVSTTAIQIDDKIIIGGYFIRYNGTATNGIARLNSDGTLDASFTVGTGANSNVKTIAIQTDGKIIIGGAFTSYNDIATNHIARLNTDGSLDATFVVGTGTNEYIETIAIQSDGKIIIGGAFTTYNGITTKNVARLNTDGSLDATFNVNVALTGPIDKAVIQKDGKIIISGFFTPSLSDPDDTKKCVLVRLNADGNMDPTFILGTTTNNTDYNVHSIALQSDGKIIIGGTFINYNGSEIKRIARLNADGSLDLTFAVGTGADNNVASMTIQNDGKIIIGGDFTSYNGTGRNRIARMNAIALPCINSTTPTLQASSITNCGIKSTTLSIATGTLNSAAAWQWYSGSCGGTAVGFGTSIIVSPTVTTTYYARGEGGCTTPGTCASITITVNPLPDVTTTLSGVTLTANQTGAVYQWLNCSQGNSSIANATNQSYTVTKNGEYSVLVTLNGCSVTSACVNVSLPCVDSTTPTLHASSIANCGTKSTTLNIVTGTLNSAMEWQWYSGSCGGTAVGSGNSISVSPNVTTTYYVRGEGGCVKPGTCASITITVNPLPTVTANATVSTLCAGASTTLTGGGALTYVWSGGVTDGIGFNPPFTRTYTVVGTDVNSCTNTATTIITVNPAPLVITRLSGAVITTNQTEATYQWLDCHLNNSSITGATNQSYTVTRNGSYAVVVTMNSCSTTSRCVDVIITAIDEMKKNNHELKLYPIPSKGAFTIQSTSEAGRYSIVNEIGQTIHVIELNDSNNYTKSIESLSPGIYFIVGFNRIKTTSQKIVITN